MECPHATANQQRCQVRSQPVLASKQPLGSPKMATCTSTALPMLCHAMAGPHYSMRMPHVEGAVAQLLVELLLLVAHARVQDDLRREGAVASTSNQL